MKYIELVQLQREYKDLVERCNNAGHEVSLWGSGWIKSSEDAAAHNVGMMPEFHISLTREEAEGKYAGYLFRLRELENTII